MLRGVKWSPFEDSIGKQIPKFECFGKTVWTQRKALSLIFFENFRSLSPREFSRIFSKIFDPSYLISAFTMTMKIQLQNIWKNGQMWDQPLEEPSKQTLLNSNVQLHLFCDASNVATAVSAYLRITDAMRSNKCFPPRKHACSPLETTNDLYAGASSVWLCQLFDKEI